MKSIRTGLALLSFLTTLAAQAEASVQCDTTPSSPIAKSVQLAINSLQEWSLEYGSPQLQQTSPEGCSEVAALPYTKILLCGEYNKRVESQLVIEAASRILDKCTARISVQYHASGSETLVDGLTVIVRRF